LLRYRKIICNTQQGVIFIPRYQPVPGQFYGDGDMSEQEVARLQEQIKTLFSDVDELKSDVKEIKQQLANRLPLWATVLMSLGPTVIELPAKAPSWHLMRWS